MWLRHLLQVESGGGYSNTNIIRSQGIAIITYIHAFGERTKTIFSFYMNFLGKLKPFLLSG